MESMCSVNGKEADCTLLHEFRYTAVNGRQADCSVISGNRVLSVLSVRI